MRKKIRKELVNEKCENCGRAGGELLIFPTGYKRDNEVRHIPKSIFDDILKAMEKLDINCVSDFLAHTAIFCLPGLLDEKDTWMLEAFKEMLED